MLKLLLERVEDKLVQDNLRKVEGYVRELPLTQDNSRVIELTFTGAVTDYLYPHQLKFVPKDALTLRKTGAGAITWNYEDFDRENISVTTTGACVVRALIGTISNG